MIAPEDDGGVVFIGALVERIEQELNENPLLEKSEVSPEGGAEAEGKAGYKLMLPKLRNAGGPEMAELRTKLNAIVLKEWADIELKFLPTSSKY